VSCPGYTFFLAIAPSAQVEPLDGF